MAAATYIGYVKFDMKFPPQTYVFALNNLILVCIAEEAFFRGYIQKYLTSFCTRYQFSKLLALAIASILFGFRHLAGVDSTQTLAKHYLLEGDADEGTVILADQQLSGSGRLGKSWDSPVGGLYCSIILKPRDKDIAKYSQLAFVIAVALFVTTAIATAEDAKPAAPVTAEAAKPADVKDAKPADAAKPAEASKSAEAAKPADAKDTKPVAPAADVKKGGKHHHHHHHGKVDMKAASAATEALNKQSGAYVASVPAPVAEVTHVEAHAVAASVATPVAAAVAHVEAAAAASVAAPAAH
eukprot:gene11209-11291_t